MYVIEKNKFPVEFLASFLVNITIMIEFGFDHFQNECIIFCDDKRIQFSNNQLITVEPRFNEPLFNEVLDNERYNFYVQAKVTVKCMEKNLDITNPPFNEQIWPVPSDFVKSRFHCNII